MAGRDEISARTDPEADIAVVMNFQVVQVVAVAMDERRALDKQQQQGNGDHKRQ